MSETLDGVRADVPGPGKAAGGPRGLSREAAAALARRGQVAYRVIETAGAGVEHRRDARRRTRLRSAKVLDAANGFVCEAIIHYRSPSGLRLLLARNVGLPARFGVYDDETGEVVTATAAWRRGQTLGVRVLREAPILPLRPSQKLALSGRYYAVRD
jgi:hypothetical protein